MIFSYLSEKNNWNKIRTSLGGIKISIFDIWDVYYYNRSKKILGLVITFSFCLQVSKSVESGIVAMTLPCWICRQLVLGSDH